MRGAEKQTADSGNPGCCRDEEFNQTVQPESVVKLISAGGFVRTQQKQPGFDALTLIMRRIVQRPEIHRGEPGGGIEALKNLSADPDHAVGISRA